MESSAPVSAPTSGQNLAKPSIPPLALFWCTDASRDNVTSPSLVLSSLPLSPPSVQRFAVIKPTVYIFYCWRDVAFMDCKRLFIFYRWFVALFNEVLLLYKTLYFN